MDEVDETVARVRACGPVPLPLGGWDHASIWGWDETTGSLYAHLWPNVGDPAKPPSIRIGVSAYTPVITFPETLAHHIAMAVECDPWEVLTALLKVDEDEYRGSEDKDTMANEAGTVVTMNEGYSVPEWPYRPQLR